MAFAVSPHFLLPLNESHYLSAAIEFSEKISAHWNIILDRRNLVAFVVFDATCPC
jgi:hypothetical protein